MNKNTRFNHPKKLKENRWRLRIIRSIQEMPIQFTEKQYEDFLMQLEDPEIDRRLH